MQLLHHSTTLVPCVIFAAVVCSFVVGAVEKSDNVNLRGMGAFTTDDSPARQYQSTIALWCTTKRKATVSSALWTRVYNTNTNEQVTVNDTEAGVTVTVETPSSNLTIHNPAFNQTGKYSCTLKDADDLTIDTCEDILVTCPPVIIYQLKTRLAPVTEDDEEEDEANRDFEQSSVNVFEGEAEVKLQCRSAGYPPLEGMDWYRFKEEDEDAENKEELKSGNRIQIMSKLEETGNFTSTLTIFNVTFDDRYVYMCTMRNRDDDTTITTVRLLLRIKNRLAWLTPSIAIVVVVIVLLVVIFGCEFREKKMQRLEEEVEEDD